MREMILENQYGFEDYVSDENIEFYEEVMKLRKNKAVLVERCLAGRTFYCEKCNQNLSEFKLIIKKRGGYSLEYVCSSCLATRLREVLR